MFGRRSASILIKYRKIHKQYLYNLTKSLTAVSLITLCIFSLKNVLFRSLLLTLDGTTRV